MHVDIDTKTFCDWMESIENDTPVHWQKICDKMSFCGYYSSSLCISSKSTSWNPPGEGLEGHEERDFMNETASL